MCHMINLTGQILPVREVVEMARRHNIPVIVDGAHALAHFPFRIPELGCDNYSTSLHKWLFAPHGTGLLFVRRSEIAGIWPLMAAPDRMNDDIRKYEEIGTHPAANYLAIGEALTFHQGIGAERKAERLRYLRDYWANRLLENDRVTLNTSLKPDFSCGIANVHVEGLDVARAERLALARTPHCECGDRARGVRRAQDLAERIYDARGAGPLCRGHGVGDPARVADGLTALPDRPVYGGPDLRESRYRSPDGGVAGCGDGAGCAKTGGDAASARAKSVPAGA